MALFVPSDAPLHERVTFPSDSAALTEQAVGDPHAVVSKAELNTV